jgi:hypothetical protein
MPAIASQPAAIQIALAIGALNSCPSSRSSALTAARLAALRAKGM